MARAQLVLPISSNGDRAESAQLVPRQGEVADSDSTAVSRVESIAASDVAAGHSDGVLAELDHGDRPGDEVDGTAGGVVDVMSPPSVVVSPWFGRVTVVAVVAVALAAAVASVEHLANLARVAGESGWRAWLLPAAVDGLVVASTMTLFRARQLAESVGWVPWFSLIVGLTASVIGNVVSVHPSLVDPGVLKIAVGATPPIALALSLHEGLEQVRGGARR